MVNKSNREALFELLKSFGSYLAFVALYVYFLIVVPEAFSLFGSIGALVAYGIALMWALIITPAYSVREIKGETELQYALIPALNVVVFVFDFSEFARYWAIQFGGFAAHSRDYWYWLRYGFSWLLDNGLANFGQIFGWNISDIHPITPVTRLLVWGYNISLEVLVVAVAISAIRIVVGNRMPSSGSLSNS